MSKNKKNIILSQFKVNKIQKLLHLPKCIIKDLLLLLNKLSANDKSNNEIKIILHYLHYLQEGGELDNVKIIREFYKKKNDYLVSLLKDSKRISQFKKEYVETMVSNEKESVNV